MTGGKIEKVNIGGKEFTINQDRQVEEIRPCKICGSTVNTEDADFHFKNGQVFNLKICNSCISKFLEEK